MEKPLLFVYTLRKTWIVGNHPFFFYGKCCDNSHLALRAEHLKGNDRHTFRRPWNQSRALFYEGRLVNSSLQGGEKYDKMRKNIVVSIIDGNLFHLKYASDNEENFKNTVRNHVLSDLAADYLDSFTDTPLVAAIKEEFSHAGDEPQM